MENEEKQASKGSNFKPIYILIVTIILILSFVGAYLLGKTVFNSNEAESAGLEEEKVVSLGPLYNSPEFTVNLANTNGRRFLMTQFSLEVANKKVLKELEEKTPIVQDKVIILLSSQSIDDLNSPTGKEKIKQQLKDNLNEVLSEGDILNVFFNKFVWQ